MYAMVKRKVALKCSSSLILAKSVKWMPTLVPKPRSYITTGGQALAFGREFKHVWQVGDNVFPSAPASSFRMRGEILTGILSRQFSSSRAEEASLIKNVFVDGLLPARPSPPAFVLGSSEGELLFSEVMQQGNLGGFLSLLNCFEVLTKPPLFGLASISTVLDALESIYQRKINDRESTSAEYMRKFPRYYTEFLLDCCDPLKRVEAEGLTFGRLAFVAYCNGAKVDPFLANKCTIDDFRKYVVQCSTSSDYFMVVYFDRAQVGEVKGSHFSPVGLYHTARDMVLVMDVSRFEYRPFWVPLELLWKAMMSIDKATGHHMGFMVLSRLPKDPCTLYTLSCRSESWISAANHIKQFPDLMRSDDVKDIEQVLTIFLKSHLDKFGKFIERVTVSDRGENDGSKLSSKLSAKRVNEQEQLSSQVQETELYKHVSKWLDTENFHCETVKSSGSKNSLPEIAVDLRSDGVAQSAMKLKSSRLYYSSGSSSNYGHLVDAAGLTMLLFVLPPHTWSGINEAMLSTVINNLVSIENLPPLLKNEVLSLRQQLKLLMLDLEP